MSARDLIGGVVPPIATPLADDLALDERSLVSLAGHVVGRGAKGVFALGSTGESAYLTTAIRRRAVEVLRAETSVPVLVGLVETTADRVVEHAAELGVTSDTIVVATGPFYAKASAAEITAHFEEIARGTSAEVLAYNIPVNVGYALPGEVLADLIERGVIAGLKDSSPDLAALRGLIRRVGTDVLLATGSDSLLDAALELGANAAVAGLANVAPDYFVKALAAHAAGDRAELARLQGLLFALTGLYAQSDSTPGLNSTQLGSIKTALCLIGVIESDAVSRPMIRSSRERVDEVAAVLREAGIEPVGTVVR